VTAIKDFELCLYDTQPAQLIGRLGEERGGESERRERERQGIAKTDVRHQLMGRREREKNAVRERH